MKKLTSMSDQINDPLFDKQTVDSLKQSVSTAIDKTNLPTITKKYLNIRTISICTFVLASIFLVLTCVVWQKIHNLSLAVLIVLIVMTIVCFIAWFILHSKLWQLKKEYKNAIVLAINHHELVKILTESKYENVKVTGLAEETSYNLASGFRTSSIPNDARVSKKHLGIDFTINGHHVSALALTWHWVRTFTTRNGTRRQDFYETNFYLTSTDFTERFQKFMIKIGHKTLFNNQGKELENEKFNKMFSYVHNDSVQLRVLLTPLIQEHFVNYFASIADSQTIFFKEADSYTLVRFLKTEPFEVDTKFQTSMDFLKNQIVADLISDTRYLLNNLSIIATFRELIK